MSTLQSYAGLVRTLQGWLGEHCTLIIQLLLKDKSNLHWNICNVASQISLDEICM